MSLSRKMDINTIRSLFELLILYVVFYLGNSGCSDLRGKQKIIGIYIKVPKLITYLLFYYPRIWKRKYKKIVLHCVIYQVFLQVITLYNIITMITNTNQV